MNTNPYVIGYWARMNDLDFDDVHGDDRLSEFVNGSYPEFNDGWEVADAEVTEQRLKNLLEDLKDVGP